MRGARPATFDRRRPRALAGAALVCLALLAAAGTWAQGRSIAGQLLVATDRMGDPRFAETVIYMIEHDREGALGLVVNRPLGQAPIAAVLERLGLEAEAERGEIAVHTGGPVEPGRAFVLHSADVMAEGSRAVDEDFAVSSRPAILRLIGQGAGPKHSIFVFGYAGWGPGQLDGELARADWFVIPAETGLVFAPDPAQSWREAVKRRAVEL